MKQPQKIPVGKKEGLNENVIRTLIQMFVRDGFFHADFHPGDIFFHEDGSIVLLDVGMFGELTSEQKERFILFNAAGLTQHFLKHKDELGFELRVTTLGHVQRGGSPTAFDRLLGIRLAAEGINRFLKGEQGILMGWKKGEVRAFPLVEVVHKKKTLDLNLLKLAQVLAQ